jgi:transposase
MWCVANLDEEYIRRMEDVLVLYEKPLSEEEPVVCVDEKPVVLHRDIRAPLPARPGDLARRDYEYKRSGTANVFCGVEPKAGRHFPKPTPNRSAAEFADYLVEIVARYPQARTIHLVLDNLNTHGRKSLTQRYGEKLGSLLWDRFTVHYTPKHGSWLNQAEIEVSLLSRQCLGKRRMGDLATLQHQVRAWNRRLNRDGNTIEWNFTRKLARRKLYYSITRTRY